MRLDDKAYAELVDVRVCEPSRIAAALERSVCGLVAGRALLYPSNGGVAGAIEAAGALVQRAADGKR